MTTTTPTAGPSGSVLPTPDELGVVLTDEPTAGDGSTSPGVPLASLVRLALRRNPRRAHLLDELEVQVVVVEELRDEEANSARHLVLQEADVMVHVGRLGMDLREAGGADRELVVARDQLGRWLEGAGLKLERFRELAPEPAQGKLTVSLWLGLKSAAVAKKKKTQSNVEVAA